MQLNIGLKVTERGRRTGQPHVMLQAAVIDIEKAVKITSGRVHLDGLVVDGTCWDVVHRC